MRIASLFIPVPVTMLLLFPQLVAPTTLLNGASSYLLSKSYSGSHKYLASVKARDGRIFAAPFSASRVLVIDPWRNISYQLSENYGSGSDKYRTSAVAADGRIFAAPSHASKVLVIDPSRNVSYQLNEDYGSGNGRKYWTSAVAPDGRIFAAPADALRVLVIDPLRNVSYQLSENYGSGSDKYISHTMAPDGRIFAAPFNAMKVLVIDPSRNISYQLSESYLGNSKYLTSAVARDGRIFAAPSHALKVLVIDPLLDISYQLSESYLGDSKYTTNVVAQDGRIFAAPNYASKVLVIDPSRNVSYQLSEDYGSNDDKYRMSAVAGDGRIFAAPRSSVSKVLVIDPLRNVSYQLSENYGSGSDKYISHTMAPDGRIFAAPFSASKVLVVYPGTYRYGTNSPTITFTPTQAPSTAPFAAPTTSPATVAPTQTQMCVRVTTGNGGSNDGIVAIAVDGTTVVNGFFARGSVVLDECADSIRSVTTWNLNWNAWAGTFEFSSDGGITYERMTCTNCSTETGPTGLVVVDGDSDGASQGAEACLNGAPCSFEVPNFSPTTSPTTTSPTTSSPTTTSPTTISPKTASPTTSPTVSPGTQTPITSMPTMIGPTAIKAQFSDDATYIVMMYNRPTELVPSLQFASSLCTYLFAPPILLKLGASPVCYFHTVTVLHVRLGRGTTLGPGNLLELNSGTVIGAGGTLSSSASNNAQIVAVLAPEVPPQVTVTLLAASAFGICETHVTVVAQLGGFAGRNMSVSWELIESGGTPSSQLRSLEEIEVVFAQATQSSKAVVSIPVFNLTSGYAMKIRVNATNFLHQTSSAVHVITKENGAQPSFILPAPLTIDAVPVWEDFRLEVQVVPPTCSMSQSVQTTQTIIAVSQWSAYKINTVTNSNSTNQNNNGLVSVPLADPTAAYLYLPVGTLTADAHYEFRLKAFAATVAGSAVSAIANITFKVFTGSYPALVAAINGGGQREVVPAYLSPVVFDASSSYDPSRGPSGNNSHLRYAWSLVDLFSRQIVPLPPVSSASSILSVNASVLVAGRLYEARVNVSSNPDGDATLRRTSTATQRVSVVSIGTPSVSIDRPPGDSPFEKGPGTLNVDTDLRLVSHVVQRSSSSSSSSSWAPSSIKTLRYNWTCQVSTDTGTKSYVLDLPSLLSPSNITTAAIGHSRHNSTYLHIPAEILRKALDPSTFTAGVRTQLSFQLTVTDAAGPSPFAGRASFVVVVNTPPRLGSCSATPASGYALQTQFQLACEGYEDADVPLTYSFSLIITDDDGDFLVDGGGGGGGSEPGGAAKRLVSLCGRRRSGYLETQLPGPLASQSTSASSASTATRIQASVFDSNGAAAHEEIRLSVEPFPNNVSLAALSRDLEGRVQEGSTQSFVVGALGVASLLLRNADAAADPGPNATSATRATRISIQEATSTRESLLSLVAEVSPSLSAAQSSARSLPRATVAGLVDQLTHYPEGRAVEISNKVTERTLTILSNLSAVPPPSSLAAASATTTSVLLEPNVNDFVASSVSSVSSIISASGAESSDGGGGNGGGQERANRVVSILMNLTVWIGARRVAGDDGARIYSPNAATPQQYRRRKRSSVALAVKTVSDSTGYSNASAPLVHTRAQFPPINTVTGNLLLSLVAVTNTTLYPENVTEAVAAGEGSGSSNVRRRVRNIVTVQVKDATNNYQTLDLSGYDAQPFRIEIPSMQGGNLSTGEGTECMFWDLAAREWNTTGVSFVGSSQRDGKNVHVCNSSHLTSFSTRSMAFQVEVNTISATDIKNTSAYNPAKSATMALTVILFGFLAALFVTAMFYDKSTAATKEAVERNEREFYRSLNQTRKLHFEEPRSAANWKKSVVLAVRRRHPWMSIFTRMPGDHIDSKKRVMILSLLILNAAAVCALLLGTEQKLGFIRGNIAVAVVALFIGFPLPLLVASMFSRETPKEFRINFTPLGLVAAIPWLFWVVSVLMGEMEYDFGLQIEDDANDDDMDQDRVGEGDDGDDDDDGLSRKKNKDEGILAADQRNTAAAAAAASGAVGVEAGLVGANAGRRYKRLQSAKAFKSTLDMQSVAAEDPGQRATGSEIRSSGSAESSRGTRSLDRVDDFDSNQNLFLRTTTSLGVPVGSISENESKRTRTQAKASQSWKKGPLDMEENGTKTVECCCGLTTLVRQSSIRPSHNEWVLRDIVAAVICVVVSVGCVFIVLVLGYQSMEKEGTDWDIVVASLLTWPQDIGIRLCTILWLEAVLTGPWLYVMFPCFMVCGLFASDVEKGVLPGTDTKHTYRFDTDRGVCKLDRRNFVVQTHDQARNVGIRRGWRLVSMNGTPVATKTDAVRELRRIHALQRHFCATFQITKTVETKGLKASPGRGLEHTSSPPSHQLSLPHHGVQDEWSPPHINTLREKVWNQLRKQRADEENA